MVSMQNTKYILLFQTATICWKKSFLTTFAAMNSLFSTFPEELLTSDAVTTLPEELTFPLPIEPHRLCIWAKEEVEKDVAARREWASELAKGKMMGVLIVAKKDEDGNKQIGYIKAYSGQIGGKSDWEGYAPAVYDYLESNGYFRRKEREIDEINNKIRYLENSNDFIEIKKRMVEMQKSIEATISSMKKEMAQKKILRDEMRSLHPEDVALHEKLERESQHMKAELKRKKKAMLAEYELVSNENDKKMDAVNVLKRERKEASDNLQRWLFDHFIMLNADGKQSSVAAIFMEERLQMPPAGTGECCAPKLLNYAFSNNLQPLSLAEFWFGQSPKGEVRHHGAFYQPCQSKCMPLLKWILHHNNNAITAYSVNRPLKMIYQDDCIIVVDKPAGMMSVRGKSNEKSVEEVLAEMFPDDKNLMIVHRLDMDTSGIMVVARRKDAHKQLQEQFAKHEIEKQYVAIVEGKTKDNGRIELPLRPDFDDRPRQIVDYEHGKVTKTRYEKISETTANDTILTRLRLYPETGRTHQLRLHCAHSEGLNCPIKGDRLYGHTADRLYLQAVKITFRHPLSEEQMSFKVEAEF